MTPDLTHKLAAVLALGVLFLLDGGLPTEAQAQEVACTAGFAGPYPCNNVDLLAIVESAALSAAICGTLGTGSDIWGWTDPLTNREYAVQTLSDATAFIDVTIPTEPVFMGCLPAPATNFLWRDAKVYNNHAYIVGDFSPLSTDDGNPDAVHGLQIFDLTRLRTAPPNSLFAEDGNYTEFDEAHNLAVNDDTGFIYVGASDTCGGGLHMLDMNSDPKNPVFAGCFDDAGINVHDAHCVSYHGPDADYQGREICVNSNEDFLDIVDVTDKNNPYRISRSTSVGQSYVHQGWLTESHQYFILGDETDELDSYTAGTPHNTYTYMWNFTDLDNPVQMKTYVGPTAAIDHNLYIRGNFLYESNYTAGLRIIDISDLANENYAEIAFFDTDPPDADVPVFGGIWSSYIYFPSGNVVSSQLEGGQLFVLKPNLPTPPDNGDDNATKTTGGGWMADADGGKLNFGYNAKEKIDGPQGNLQFKDKSAGVNIKMSDVTLISGVQGMCGSITNSANALEFRGNGTFNKNAASFRVCVVDNGEPGNGSDRFHLECTSGCNYSTVTRASDDVIDGGNIQVHRADNGEPAESSTAPAGAATIILDPLLLDTVAAGQSLVFDAQVFDHVQSPIAGEDFHIHAKDLITGDVTILDAITDGDGLAHFHLALPAGASELQVIAGDVQSNVVELTAL